MSAIAQRLAAAADPSPDASLRRLAAAVILQAIFDASREGMHAGDARRFVFSDEEIFPFWCEVCKVNPEQVREAVRRGAGASGGRGGQLRIHASHAERQAAYYRRRKGLG